MSEPDTKPSKKTGKGKAASHKTLESTAPSRRVWLIGCGVLALLALLALFGGGGSEKKTIYQLAANVKQQKLAPLLLSLVYLLVITLINGSIYVHFKYVYTR